MKIKSPFAEPKEGMGATQILGDKLFPFTITSVSKNKKRVNARSDNFILVDMGPNHSAEYQFMDNPLGAVHSFVLRADGIWWNKTAGRLVPGRRRAKV